jgi:hypothetical protein
MPEEGGGGRLGGMGAGEACSPRLLAVSSAIAGAYRAVRRNMTRM